MSSIRLTAFSGEQPRIIPRLMNENSAQAAHDVRLDDGGLTPIRVSSIEGGMDVENVKTIFLWGDEWLGWDKVVHAVPGPIAADRLYYTGDGPPKIKVRAPDGGISVDTIFNLKVPRPTVKLTATTTGSSSSPDNPQMTRIYVYTWVTGFGEESEPAPASNMVEWQDGQSVVLTGFQAVPTGRHVTLQRIYRSQTGPQGTLYYFIHERAATNADYTDSIPLEQIGEPLPSLAWNAPPDSLEGLIVLPNGVMAAFTGKKLYFSVPYQPHAWPEKYVLTTEHPIMGLGAIGLTIVVATNAHPYVATGSMPENMVMQKLEQNLACINKRSIVDMGYAIAYASHEGLVVARADGGIGIVSAALFNRDGWLIYDPLTIIGCQIAGRYVAFYNALQEDLSYKKGALIIDLSNPAFLVHTETEAVACVYHLEHSALYYTPPLSSVVMRLDSPRGIRKRLYWKSKEFVLPAPDNFGAFLIDGIEQRTKEEQAAFDAAVAAAVAYNQTLLALPTIEGDINAIEMNVQELNGDILGPVPQDDMVINVGIYADNKLVASLNKTNVALRLPSGFKARIWEIDIATNMEIYRMAMAKSMDELKVTA